MDVDGNNQTAGGDRFAVRVQSPCSADTDSFKYCYPDKGEDYFSEWYEMTDNGDGTYSVSFYPPADEAPFELSAELLVQGILEEQLDNSSYTGLPNTVVRQDFAWDYDFGVSPNTDEIISANRGDSYASLYGILEVPFDGDYVFTVYSSQ